MADTCDRCAARDRATLERAARWLEKERGRYSSADELWRMYAATPAPCDCAARDRVVEAAVFKQCERSTARRLDVGPAGTWLAQGIVDAMRRAVAALEGAEHE